MAESVHQDVTEVQNAKEDFLRLLRDAIRGKDLTGPQVEAFKLFADVNGWLKSKTEKTLEAAAKLGVTPRGPGQTVKRTVKAVAKKSERGMVYDLSEFEKKQEEP
jgi:hypothetical protein